MDGGGRKFFRTLCRTDKWQIRWRIAKDTATPLFSGSAIEWDRNRLNLIKWLNFYEWIYTLTDDEKPSDETIQDDTKLDLWYEDYRLQKKEEVVNRIAGNANASGNNVDVFNINYEDEDIPYAETEEGKPDILDFKGKTIKK